MSRYRHPGYHARKAMRRVAEADLQRQRVQLRAVAAFVQAAWSGPALLPVLDVPWLDDVLLDAEPAADHPPRLPSPGLH